MEEIERAMCQLYHGSSRPLQWQDHWPAELLPTLSSGPAPDVQALAKAILRLPNF